MDRNDRKYKWTFKNVLAAIPTTPFTVKLYSMWTLLTGFGKVQLRDRFIKEFPAEKDMFFAIVGAFHLWDHEFPDEKRQIDPKHPMKTDESLKRLLIITALHTQGMIALMAEEEENTSPSNASERNEITDDATDSAGIDGVESEKHVGSEDKTDDQIGKSENEDMKLNDLNDSDETLQDDYLSAEEREMAEQLLTDMVGKLRVRLYQTFKKLEEMAIRTAKAKKEKSGETDVAELEILKQTLAYADIKEIFPTNNSFDSITQNIIPKEDDKTLNSKGEKEVTKTHPSDEHVEQTKDTNVEEDHEESVQTTAKTGASRRRNKNKRRNKKEPKKLKKLTVDSAKDYFTLLV